MVLKNLETYGKTIIFFLSWRLKLALGLSKKRRCMDNHCQLDILIKTQLISNPTQELHESEWIGALVNEAS